MNISSSKIPKKVKMTAIEAKNEKGKKGLFTN